MKISNHALVAVLGSGSKRSILMKSTGESGQTWSGLDFKNQLNTLKMLPSVTRLMVLRIAFGNYTVTTCYPSK